MIPKSLKISASIDTLNEGFNDDLALEILAQKEITNENLSEMPSG